MNKLNEILEFNHSFVENKDYVQYSTTKNPNKKLVILSCMDTRLSVLLPQALNLKNGDAKIIKNAGASVTHPFGSIIRSIIVAIYEFQTDEVLVIGHHNCGMSNLDPKKVLEKAVSRGISPDVMDILSHSGVDIHQWLLGFSSEEESVRESVSMIKNHPLVPKDVNVHGLIMNPETGKLDVIINGYDS